MLVAEDDPVLSQMVARALILAGYHVTTAADGLAALELVRSRRYDVLLTDLTMPGLAGDALALAARSERAGPPVVLMSAAPEAIRRDGPWVAVVKKPFAIDALVSTIDSALATSSLAR